MPFIGKLPDVGAFRLIDSITTSATDTYALQVEGLSYFPSSARNLIVSLNGVTQAPESAYTVSGSNIVFASALTASDVIDYILVIGESVDIGTPSDNTVGNAQLKSDLDFSGKTLTFSADQISGDAISGGTISSFASTGIDDNATSTAITIKPSGNVCIGADNPSEALTIAKSGTSARISLTDMDSARASMTGLLEFDGTDNRAGFIGYDAGDMSLYAAVGDIKLSTGGAARLTINETTGNVGIGKTPSSSYALDVSGNVYAGTYTIPNGNSYKAIQNDGTEDNVLYYSALDELFLGRDNGALKLRTSGQIRATIDYNGNVGIGIAPSAANQSYVSSAYTEAIIQGNSPNKIGSLQIRSAGTANTTHFELAAADGLAASYIWNGTASDMVFGTNNSERMRIDSSGNLLVGTTSAASLLDGNKAGIDLRAAQTGDAVFLQSGSRTVRDLNDSLVIANTGGLSITGSSFGSTNKPTGNYGMTFSLNTFLQGGTGNAYVTQFHVTTGDSLYVRSSVNAQAASPTWTSWSSFDKTAVSDARLKENIVDSESALPVVNQVKVRSFDWKDDIKEPVDYGFVAQELEQVFPSAVVEPVDENNEVMPDMMKSVSEQRMVPLLVKAIQEQQAIIESLTARVAALETN